MLAEMIENMYTTDIFADEDMRGDLDWNTLLGKVVENVLAILWIDNGPVTMLTTIHNIGEEWTVTHEHHRPRKTSSNANTVYQVFGNLSRKALEIPKIIDDYNQYMGSAVVWTLQTN